SSLENDYIKNGFIAHNRSEELPNPELYVRFLLRTENVSPRVLRNVHPAMTERERTAVIDSVMYIIQHEVSETDSTLIGIVDAYYGGSEFWLSIYRDFNDVRLVFAPPSSVGKFGWDTDNWMWPRHTGDFCIFRIYADKNNQPADYSGNNVPYHSPYVVPISLKGYEEGSFCMTLGYPGSTERYLSSFGIEEMINNRNQAIIDVRSVKQAIWKREMDRDTDIRIKYAAKYAESSNYWKNSIGMNNAI
ncbi:Dipeptidyl-peptidase 7, partial [termite gut metagenome]